MKPNRPLTEVLAPYLDDVPDLDFRNMERIMKTLRGTQADLDHRKGLELLQAGKFQEALEQFNRDVEQSPFNAVYRSNRGICHLYLGDNKNARRDYEKSISMASRYVDAIYNLGKLELQENHAMAAKRRFKRVLEIDMIHADAMNEILNILSTMAQAGKAKEALKDFNEYILSFQPLNPAVWDCYGTILQLDSQLILSRKAFNASLELNFDNPSAQLLHNLSDILFMIGEQETSISFNHKFLVSNNPGKNCDPSEYVSQHSAYLFKCLTICAGFKENVSAFKGWAQTHADHLYPPNPPELKWDGKRKIRVGFISQDFNNHSAQLSFGILITHYNRELFQVVCYNDNPKKDQITRALESQASAWRDVSTLSDDNLASLIKEDAIDVLIDLQGHTASNRLLVFARKPAPIQITGLGFGYTTGMKAMDYIFTDPVILPKQYRDLIPEKCIDLKSFIHWPKPPYEMEREQPFQKNGFITFGNFGSLFKITPEVIETWATILKEIPGSQLILKTGVYNDPLLCDYVLQKFVKKGVKNKITFMGNTPHYQHLQTHNLCDIMLDTFPYSGGITTCEALFMGKPVVSLDSQGTRASESILASTFGDLYYTLGGREDRSTIQSYIKEAKELSSDLQAYNDHLYIADEFLASPITDSTAYCNDVYDKIYTLVKENTNV
jgi:predicted O-linked N-acetylglucosamine transferase (SPINDLY family)